ncbi:MAG: hypothetical protein RBR14_04420 [Candidatus Cloacimonas acidaminovorans]|nr:hypothetical protein [Candidatus Cloacimonas acidaminovorans]
MTILIPYHRVKNPLLISVVPTELIFLQIDMLPTIFLSPGSKPVVSICHSYGTLFPTNRYVTYHLSFTGLKTRC